MKVRLFFEHEDGDFGRKNIRLPDDTPLPDVVMWSGHVCVRVQRERPTSDGYWLYVEVDAVQIDET